MGTSAVVKKSAIVGVVPNPLTPVYSEIIPDAPVNMSDTSHKGSTVHTLISWLKSLAPLNIPLISATNDMSHDEISLLNTSLL